jgi:hypothetical protein
MVLGRGAGYGGETLGLPARPQPVNVGVVQEEDGVVGGEASGHVAADKVVAAVVGARRYLWMSCVVHGHHLAHDGLERRQGGGVTHMLTRLFVRLHCGDVVTAAPLRVGSGPSRPEPAASVRRSAHAPGAPGASGSAERMVWSRGS